MDFYNRTACAKIAFGMSTYRLLLASQSPRRHELLRLLGLPFKIVDSDAKEVPRPDEAPAELAVRLSRAKARGTNPDAHVDSLIIACDTVGALDGEILGKPEDAAEAREMLRRLRDRPHIVYSAVTLLDTARRAVTDLARTLVRMRPYSDEEIAAYVASGDPMDKAAAYAIQHDGFDPVAGLSTPSNPDARGGCYANVMGLPLCHLTRCLRLWGIKPPRDVPTACQAHNGYRCAIHDGILSARCPDDG